MFIIKMSHYLSNFLDYKTSIADTFKNDENFLKEFLRNFYQKIINTNDFSNFENTLINDRIMNIDQNAKTILKLMQNHEENEFWFSSIIGFFYQYGIGCDVDKKKALELYLSYVNNEESLNQKFINLQKNENEFNVLQNINVNIGKYLLSLFYYRDIILDE